MALLTFHNGETVTSSSVRYVKTGYGTSSHDDAVWSFEITTAGINKVTGLTFTFKWKNISGVGGYETASGNQRFCFQIASTGTAGQRAYNSNHADSLAWKEVKGAFTGSSGTYTVSFTGLTLNPDTTYYIRVNSANGTTSGVYREVMKLVAADTAEYTVSSATYVTKILTITKDANTTVTVNRTSSNGGSTGNLSSGATLYYGDKLVITFAAAANYKVTTNTVNGSTFTSGGTHTVTANVTVVGYSTPQASTFTASNATIGGTSTITINKSNSSYTHTLAYSFSGLTGTIATKTTSASVSWTIPTTFYAKIPNSTSGTCTITCTTFNGNTQVGSAISKTITVSVTNATSGLTVSGSVVTTDSISNILTGGTSTLIRYVSEVTATITASSSTNATIASKSINGTNVNGTTRTFTNISTNAFSFAAVDSRGFSKTADITPSMVNYVMLTSTPEITRPNATGNTVQLSYSGNYYNGSFGAKTNEIGVYYRYKASSSSSWEAWTWATVSTDSHTAAQLTISGNTYRGSVTLSGFDYNVPYDFQIYVYDGTNIKASSTTRLSSVYTALTVKPGIPIFDWGENDFNFNVPVNFSSTVSGPIIVADGQVAIPSNANLNNYTTPGTYYVQNSTIGQTITNTAFTTTGYMLFVFRPLANPDAPTAYGYRTQIAMSWQGPIVIRYLNGADSTWSAWKGLQTAVTYGTGNPSGGSDGDVYIKYTS